MSFLRRMLGSRESSDGDGSGDRTATPASGDLDADERAYELELLRAEQERLDELRLRQLRYADRAWTPPSQGGERRADDAEGTEAESD